RRLSALQSAVLGRLAGAAPRSKRAGIGRWRRSASAGAARCVGADASGNRVSSLPNTRGPTLSRNERRLRAGERGGGNAARGARLRSTLRPPLPRAAEFPGAPHAQALALRRCDAAIAIPARERRAPGSIWPMARALRG